MSAAVARWARRGAWALTLTAVFIALPTAASASTASRSWWDKFFDFVVGRNPEVTPNLMGADLQDVHIADSSGIAIRTYALSIDEGGVLSPAKQVWSAIVQWLWSFYHSVATLCIRLVDFVMSGTWIDMLAQPFIAVGEVLQTAMDRLHIVPVFLTITVVVAMVSAFRGRAVVGLWNVAVAMVVAALMTTVLYNPTAMIAGADGLLGGAVRASQEISAEFEQTEGLPPEQTTQATIMADVLIAAPARAINFGTTDLGECEEVYLDELRTADKWNTEAIYKAVDRCDKDLGQWAKNPNPSMVTTALSFYLTSPALFLLTILLAGGILLAGVRIIYAGLEIIFSLVTGLLPNAARKPIANTAASLMVNVFLMVVLALFLTVTMEIIRAFVSEAPSSQHGARMWLLAAVIYTLIIVFWKVRKKIVNSQDGLASWLRWQPGGGATRTTHQEFDWGRAAHTAAMWAQTIYGRATARNTGHMANQGGGTTSYRSATGTSPVTHLGTFNTQVPAHPALVTPVPTAPVVRQIQGPSTSYASASGAAPPPKPPRARVVVVDVATSAALGAVTGGSSTIVRGAVQAGRIARSVHRARTVAQIEGRKP